MKRKVPSSASNGLLVGVVLGAQGLKGEVKVKTFTQSPAGIGRYGPLLAEDGRKFSVKAVKPLKGDSVVLQLKGIVDRNSAEQLKGVQLYVPRAALPEPGKNEFYHADLVGLSVETASGKKVGTVRAVHNFGAGDVLEIADDETDTSFIPFTKDHVPEVDIAGGRLVVNDSAFWQDEKQ